VEICEKAFPSKRKKQRLCRLCFSQNCWTYTSLLLLYYFFGQNCRDQICKTPERFHAYHSVNHAVSGVSRVPYMHGRWNNNLGNSFPHLNAAVTPLTSDYVCGMAFEILAPSTFCHLKQIKYTSCQLFLQIEFVFEF